MVARFVSLNVFDVLSVTGRVRRNKDGEEPRGDAESRDILACEADGILEV